MIVSYRGLATEALTETGHVLSGTVVDDGGGGGTLTYTQGGTVRCRIDALAGDEGEVAEKVADRSTHVITLPADTEVTVANDFIVNGRGTFEVTAVREHSGEFSRFIEAVPRT